MPRRRARPESGFSSRSKAGRSLAAAAVLWAAACGDGGPGVVDPTPAPNRGPETVGAIPAQTVSVGETATVDVSPYFRDADGDVLSYAATSSNTGAGSATASGSSVAVAPLAKGVFTVTVTARDPSGLAAQQSFQVTVPNRGPEATGTIPAQTVFAGETASVDVSAYFIDPDGDPLGYAATSSDERLARAAVAGAVITIEGVSQGVATVTVRATDGDGGEAEQSFQVTVPNRGPEAAGTIPARTVSVGETATIDVSSYFRDADGDVLSYTATSSNTGVGGVSVSGSSVVVSALAKGVFTVTVTARDPQGLTARQSFQVTVPNRGPEPAGTIPAQTVFAGETASVDVSAYFRDPDGDPLGYSTASSDARFARATAAGAVVTIEGVSRGVATVKVTATDGDGGAAEQSFRVTVPNRGPEATGTIPAQAVSVGETATIDAAPYFRDADGDVLSYTATSSNTGVGSASVSGSSVVISALTKGVFTVTVTARDPQGLTAQQSFQVTVPNRGPEATGTIPAQTVFTGETASVDVSAHFRDPDGDPLAYLAASSASSVVSVSLSGGTLTLVGRAAGTATVTVTARDPDGLMAAQSLSVTVVTRNRGPEAVGSISNQTVETGQTATLDVASYFRDPDDDALTYSAATSAPGVATVSVSGSVLTIVGAAVGTATVTVTARDPHGLTAGSLFDVTVVTSGSGFHIELVFATAVTPTQRAAFESAAERWMTILAPTELRDMVVNRTLTCGDDPRFARYVERIDDLLIVAAVGEIDGPGGTLGQAGPCLGRFDGPFVFPYYGRMEFDAADLDELERSGDLDDVILHEMGHVLGIGTLWDLVGLLRNPSSETGVLDTHFEGRRAIDAFDDAGGAGYNGAKVPVENTGGPGTVNSHWRGNRQEPVFGMELMVGWADGGSERSPLSAITIQSLADLGYAVDVTAADPYRLPGADAARLIGEARRIPYGNDIWKGPFVIVDADGRILRVIPG